LWELPLGEVEKFAEKGMTIDFWKIERKWNLVAGSLVKEGADEEAVPEEYYTITGFA
jgi:hypothetical protein